MIVVENFLLIRARRKRSHGPARTKNADELDVVASPRLWLGMELCSDLRIESYESASWLGLHTQVNQE
jgi:hypothetical protein